MVNVASVFGEWVKTSIINIKNSTEVGRSIMTAASSNFKRVNLELGGKSALIIFADADREFRFPKLIYSIWFVCVNHGKFVSPSVDETASVAFKSIMFNAGQYCAAASRTFVEAPIYEEMLERFRRMAEQRVVGDPFELGVEQGPQVQVDSRIT